MNVQNGCVETFDDMNRIIRYYILLIEIIWVRENVTVHVAINAAEIVCFERLLFKKTLNWSTRGAKSIVLAEHVPIIQMDFRNRSLCNLIQQIGTRSSKANNAYFLLPEFVRDIGNSSARGVGTSATTRARP